MSITYTPTTTFSAKDTLPANDPNKVIVGAEFTAEFNAIQAAFALAAPTSNPTFSGTATYGNLTVTGSFTSRGIDDNATTNSITIDANENVGIKATNPQSTLHVGGTFRTTSAFTSFVVDPTIAGSGYEALVALTDTGVENTLNTNSRGFVWSNGLGEHMRIASTGKVGIGTSTPNQRLTLGDPTTTNTVGLDFETANVSRGSILFNASQGSMDLTSGYAGYGGKFTFTANGDERVRITQEGYVGIGTQNPTESLTVNGTGYFFNSAAEIRLAPDNAIGLDFGASYASIPAAQTHGYIATAASSAGGVNGDLLIAPRTSAGASLRFITGTTPTERVRIGADGTVDITNDLTVNGAFTSTGIDDNATSTAMTITHDEKVGIGKGITGPSFQVDVLSEAGIQSILRARQAGSSNGFTILGDGSEYDYQMLDGDLRVVRNGTTGISSIQLGGEAPDNARRGGIFKNLETYDMTYNNQTNTSVVVGKHIFKNGPDTHMVLDDLGNMGIGTEAPVSYQQGPAINIGSTSTPYAQLNFTTATNGIQYIAFGDSTTGNERYQGLISFDHNTNKMGFGTKASTTPGMHITSLGDLNVGVTAGTPTGGNVLQNGAGTKSGPVMSIGGTDVNVTTGDTIGALAFVSADASFTGVYADGIGAQIAAVTETAVGGGYGLAFTTGVTTGTNRAERVRIDYAGNVGIGVKTPARTLHVSDVMRLEPSSEPSVPSAGDIYYDSSTNKLRCYNGSIWNDCF